MAVMILFCLISRFNITLTSNRYYLDWYLCFDVEQFSMKCLKQCRLVWFYVTQSFDWSRKLAPSSQPIKCKAKNNFDFVIRVFPLHKKFVCFQFVFSLANDNVNLIGRSLKGLPQNSKRQSGFCFGFFPGGDRPSPGFSWFSPRKSPQNR